MMFFFPVEKLLAVSYMEVLKKAPVVDDSTVVIEAVSVNNSAMEVLPGAEGKTGSVEIEVEEVAADDC